jgi:hypothetical protein
MKQESTRFKFTNSSDASIFRTHMRTMGGSGGQTMRQYRYEYAYKDDIEPQ